MGVAERSARIAEAVWNQGERRAVWVVGAGDELEIAQVIRYSALDELIGFEAGLNKGVVLRDGDEVRAVFASGAESVVAPGRMWWHAPGAAADAVFETESTWVLRRCVGLASRARSLDPLPSPGELWVRVALEMLLEALEASDGTVGGERVLGVLQGLLGRRPARSWEQEWARNQNDPAAVWLGAELWAHRMDVTHADTWELAERLWWCCATGKIPPGCGREIAACAGLPDPDRYRGGR